MSNAADLNRDDAVPTEKKLDDLYKLIEGIEVAMFTTRRTDGHLVSRPMATQKREEGTDFWFVTDLTTNKLDELAYDSHVNLAYYNMKSREWVSVAGTAIVSQDREMIRELYKPDWKAWFGDNGGDQNGGPDDPRLALILIEAHTAEYLVVNQPRPVVMFQVARAIATGTPPKIGKQRSVTERELHSEPIREAGA
jgi:general stress protein 26